MNQISIATAINKSNLSTADKRALLAIHNGMADDLEQLRAAVAALTAKLDAAGAGVAGLGTNFTATIAIPKTSMNLKKS